MRNCRVRRGLVGALLFAACVLPHAVLATTTTGCSNITTAPLNFGGNIVPGASGVTINSTTTVSVTCATGTSFTLLLDQGLHPNGSGERQLGGTSTDLLYGLYQDGNRTTPWGNGTTGGNGEAGYGTGSAEPFLVYATLTVPGNTPIGSYTDSVTLTVSF